MKAEVVVLGSPALISPMVSVNVKHHERRGLCVRMAVGINDCRYRVVLLGGIQNLSFLRLCLLSNSGLSGCV